VNYSVCSISRYSIQAASQQRDGSSTNKEKTYFFEVIIHLLLLAELNSPGASLEADFT
jgi:hypothetical protein